MMGMIDGKALALGLLFSGTDFVVGSTDIGPADRATLGGLHDGWSDETLR